LIAVKSSWRADEVEAVSGDGESEEDDADEGDPVDHPEGAPLSIIFEG
jgi:hypothetical protein